MTGLKSGAGDDLWGESADTGSDGERKGPDSANDAATSEADADARTAEEAAETSTDDEATDSETVDDEAIDGEATDSQATDEGDASEGAAEEHPYIVRRAIQNRSVQFERDERLTFFVHDDVAEGERELVTEIESALGRGVPKFDVREAVYRAALRNRDDVVEELLAMGYTLDEE